MKFVALFAALTLCALSDASAQQPAGLAGLLGAADANGDGVVTRAEFETASATRFAQRDANSDGVISPADRPQSAPDASTPVNGDATARTAYNAAYASLFSRLDQNGDDQISPSELPSEAEARTLLRTWAAALP